mmetsp:Transcript_10036/g.25574  ORF Transcript_10036/g.25574 Transcript_10036/m.25574 type:complete len:368 (+) Transcript_10036:58-1161(+)|eukprot:jgi/Tetstr1/466312/TSEL_010844.t1
MAAQPEQREPGGEATADAAARVVDRMAAKNEERLKDAERRKEEARAQADPRESVDAFHTKSSAACEAWRRQLAEVSSGSLSSEQAKAALDGLAGQLQGLEAELATASYFLPAYDQRSTKCTYKEMQAELDAARGALVPKKKFSFGGRVARKKAADVAEVASSAAASVAASRAVVAAPVEPPEVKPGRGLQGLRGATVVVTAEQLGGNDFTLMDLEDCKVFLLGRMSALRCHRMSRCRVFCGPVAGSSFFDAVQDCLLHVPSHQVRIHSTTGTDFYLRVRSNPIIEHSSGLRVAPCAFDDWPGARTLLAGAGLAPDDDDVVGKWRQVDDFGWLRAVQSPNWAVLPEEERQPADAAVEPGQPGVMGLPL